MTRLSRAAGLVSLATLVSRVLGLLRDSVRAALFGSGWLSDALDVAFKVPNLFRDLFAEGAFSGAFVPTIMRTHEREGRAAALVLLNRVLSTMLVYVGALCLVLISFAPWIVRILASPTFVEQPEFRDAVVLVRILAPFLLLICLAVAAMGALNVLGKYFVPALSPAAQNLVLVLGGLVVYKAVAEAPARAVPWAFLLLAGGALQFLIQVPPLLRAGWRPRFLPDLRLRTEETRQMLRRMLPVVAGLAATNLCILINTRLATDDQGGTSNLYYAFRLVHLPVGLVGVAVGTAVLAEASRRAAVHDEEGARETLAEALLLCLAFAAPAAAGLLALGPPIADLLFHWGRQMDLGRTAAIGLTIRWFAPAVVFYCAVKVVVPFFHAQGRVRIPVFASMTAVVANLACALTTHRWLRWNGLALAVGVGQLANLLVLLVFTGALHGWPGRALFGRLGKIALASAVCAGVAAATVPLFPAGEGALPRLLRGLVPVATGAVAYLAAGRLLRCPEIESLVRALGRFARLDKGRRGA
ncbi:MAG TPA: murein biosynthesis integral membrane protein MurJ [Planctomycetota bacterium]|nr:murein biosynthesis integral membrane protein MurJ [Planctomycetota bacterium]